MSVFIIRALQAKNFLYNNDSPLTINQKRDLLHNDTTLINTFPHTTPTYFTDVPGDHIFFQFIQRMKDLGITSGCSLTVSIT